VRRGASLDPNQTYWQFLEERKDGATLQLAADEHLAGGINAVDLQAVTTIGLDIAKSVFQMSSSSESWEP
jgi:hypothetical protein